MVAVLIDDYVAFAVVPAKVGIIGGGHSAHPGQRGEGFDYALLQGDYSVLWIAGHSWVEVEGEQAIGRKARIHLVQVLDSAHKKASSHNEQQAEADLQGHAAAAE